MFQGFKSSPGHLEWQNLYLGRSWGVYDRQFRNLWCHLYSNSLQNQPNKVSEICHPTSDSLPSIITPVYTVLLFAI